MRKEAVRLSEEVAAALAEGRPVVALESSVVAQGLPAPHNLEAARACERAVRDAGAVPAITAVVAGQPCAGLSPDELARLADPSTRSAKIGARDFSVAAARCVWGGTTVSAACTVAAAVGIPLFATGGIGGVHRDAEKTFDVSQDLAALARCRVAVVTAGAKAVLDLPRTLELLEALAVPVIGYGTDEFPSFYTARSGLFLEHRVEDEGAAAEILRARWDRLGEGGGVVFANPVPAAHQADPGRIDRAVEEAVREAARRQVRGKALTPFLLAEVARRTSGESLQANLALLVSNAAVAARIAVAYRARRRP
jgi:pseudouridine-5'-phosphate glycosidase